MDEVYGNIDQYRMEALKKISMEKYDEVQVGCDPDIQGKYKKRDKLYQFQARMFQLTRYFTWANIVITIAVLAFVAVYVVPEMCYALACFDRHYFGWLHEPEPYYAKTTANQKFYSEHNIPFVTSADIKLNYE